MRVSTLEAVQVGFDAKHWSTGPLGDDTGSERLERTTKAVLEFMREDVPRELKFAASSIWLAVEHSDVATLYGAIHERGFRRGYTQSEDGWRMLVLRRGEGTQVPETVGLAFTRSGLEPADYHDSLVISVSSRGGIHREPQTPYTDAYLWVRPGSRNQGVANEAMGSLEFYRHGEYRVPFEVDLGNAAVAKLMERHVPQEASATA